MPTGETHDVEFFVTKLDKGYSVVLGYDWLVQHNPAIDWIKTKVIFRKPLEVLTVDKLVAMKINICRVSAKNLKKLSQEPGATMFFISKLSDSPSSDYSIRPIDMKAAELGNNAPTFPLEYQEFADVFSGKKQTHYHLIDLTTYRSTLKVMRSPSMDPSIHCHHRS